MKRREFITLLGGAAAEFPLPALAQPNKMRRVGVLMAGAELDLEWPRLEAALEQELKNLGWTRGRDIRIDYRWPGDDTDRINAYAIDLVELGSDLIVAASTFGVQAVRRRTESIPVIFMNVADPVASGLVPNLNRPGGATTGFTAADYRICGKWLEIIKEMAPRTSRVALIFNPDTASQAKHFLSPIEAAAPAFATKPVSTPFRTAQDVERTIEGFARTQSALLIMPDSSTILHRQLIIELASKHKLPAVYPFRFFATDGGLASFGINMAAQCSEVAAYIDRILRGREPGELPVQPPSKFELVINMKTAKTAGIAVPPALLGRANEVID
jgi:putative ABC transport system substrate-binding protein